MEFPDIPNGSDDNSLVSNTGTVPLSNTGLDALSLDGTLLSQAASGPNTPGFVDGFIEGASDTTTSLINTLNSALEDSVGAWVFAGVRQIQIPQVGDKPKTVTIIPAVIMPPVQDLTDGESVAGAVGNVVSTLGPNVTKPTFFLAIAGLAPGNPILATWNPQTGAVEVGTTVGPAFLFNNFETARQPGAQNVPAQDADFFIFQNARLGVNEALEGEPQNSLNLGTLLRTRPLERIPEGIERMLNSASSFLLRKAGEVAKKGKNPKLAGLSGGLLTLAGAAARVGATFFDDMALFYGPAFRAGYNIDFENLGESTINLNGGSISINDLALASDDFIDFAENTYRDLRDEISDSIRKEPFDLDDLFFLPRRRLPDGGGIDGPRYEYNRDGVAALTIAALDSNVDPLSLINTALNVFARQSDDDSLNILRENSREVVYTPGTRMDISRAVILGLFSAGLQSDGTAGGRRFSDMSPAEADQLLRTDLSQHRLYDTDAFGDLNFANLDQVVTEMLLWRRPEEVYARLDALARRLWDMGYPLNFGSRFLAEAIDKAKTENNDLRVAPDFLQIKSYFEGAGEFVPTNSGVFSSDFFDLLDELEGRTEIASGGIVSDGQSTIFNAPSAPEIPEQSTLLDDLLATIPEGNSLEDRGTASLDELLDGVLDPKSDQELKAAIALLNARLGTNLSSPDDAKPLTGDAFDLFSALVNLPANDTIPGTTIPTSSVVGVFDNFDRISSEGVPDADFDPEIGVSLLLDNGNIVTPGGVELIRNADNVTIAARSTNSQGDVFVALSDGQGNFSDAVLETSLTDDEIALIDAFRSEDVAPVAPPSGDTEIEPPEPVVSRPADTLTGRLLEFKTDLELATQVTGAFDNQVGTVFLSALNTVVDTALAIENPASGNVVGTFLDGAGRNINEILSLLGRGDIATFGEVVSDIGKYISAASANDPNALTQAGEGLGILASSTRAVGTLQDNNTLVLAGMVLDVAAEAVKAAGNDQASVELTVAGGIGDLVTFLGSSSGNSGLLALGAGLKGGSLALEQLRNGEDLAALGTSVGTVTSAISFLLDDDGARVVKNLGDAGSTYIKLQAGKIDAAAAWPSIALSLAEAAGLDIPGEVKLASQIGIGVAIGSVGTLLGAFVGFAFGALNAGTFDQVVDLIDNIDLDGDGIADDNLDFQQTFRRGIFGKVRKVEDKLIYNIENIHLEQLDTMLYRVTDNADGTSTLSVVAVYPEINPSVGEFTQKDFVISRAQADDFRAQRAALDAPGAGVLNDGLVYGYHQHFLPPISADRGIFAVSDDKVYQIQYIDSVAAARNLSGISLLNGHLEASKGVSSRLGYAAMDIVNGRVQPSGLGYHPDHGRTFRPDEINEWGIINRGDPMLSEPGILTPFLTDPAISNVTGLGKRNDPNLYFYADVNGDGTSDLIRNGLQGDYLSVQGDGQYEVWLFQEGNHAISRAPDAIEGNTEGSIGSFTASSLEEAVEIGQSAEVLYEWVANRPDLWVDADPRFQRGADGMITDSTTGASIGYAQDGALFGWNRTGISDVIASAKAEGVYDDLIRIAEIERDLTIVAGGGSLPEGVSDVDLSAEFAALKTKVGGLIDTDALRAEQGSLANGKTDTELLYTFVAGPRTFFEPRAGATPNAGYNIRSENDLIILDSNTSTLRTLSRLIDTRENGSTNVTITPDGRVSVNLQVRGGDAFGGIADLTAYANFTAASFEDAQNMADMRGALALWAGAQPARFTLATPLQQIYAAAKADGALPSLEAIADTLNTLESLEPGTVSDDQLDAIWDNMVTFAEPIGGLVNARTLMASDPGALGYATALDATPDLGALGYYALASGLPGGAAQLFGANGIETFRDLDLDGRAEVLRLQSDGDITLATAPEVVDPNAETFQMARATMRYTPRLNQYGANPPSPTGHRNYVPTTSTDYIGIATVTPANARSSMARENQFSQVDFTLTGPDAQYFTILDEGNEAMVVLNPYASLPQGRTLNVTVVTTDQAGGRIANAITVTVDDRTDEGGINIFDSFETGQLSRSLVGSASPQVTVVSPSISEPTEITTLTPRTLDGAGFQAAALQGMTFDVSGEDAQYFTVEPGANGRSGVLMLNPSAQLSLEDELTVTVTATDRFGQTISQEITVDVYQSEATSWSISEPSLRRVQSTIGMTAYVAQMDLGDTSNPNVEITGTGAELVYVANGYIWLRGNEDTTDWDNLNLDLDITVTDAFDPSQAQTFDLTFQTQNGIVVS